MCFALCEIYVVDLSEVLMCFQVLLILAIAINNDMYLGPLLEQY